jgi:hypothetical protein
MLRRERLLDRQSGIDLASTRQEERIKKTDNVKLLKLIAEGAIY